MFGWVISTRHASNENDGLKIFSLQINRTHLIPSSFHSPGRQNIAKITLHDPHGMTLVAAFVSTLLDISPPFASH